VIELQRIFYTVNPVQVSGGGEQNVWGGQAASLGAGGATAPPLPRPRTATAAQLVFCTRTFNPSTQNTIRSAWAELTYDRVHKTANFRVLQWH